MQQWVYTLGMMRVGALIDRDARAPRTDTSSTFAQNRSSVARLRRAANGTLNIDFCVHARAAARFAGHSSFVPRPIATRRLLDACVQVAKRTRQAGRNSAARLTAAPLRQAASSRYPGRPAPLASRFGAHRGRAVEFFPRPRSRVLFIRQQVSKDVSSWGSHPVPHQTRQAFG